MANVLRLAKYDLTNSLVSSIDLLDGTLKLEEESWRTQMAVPRMLYEKLSLGMQATFMEYAPVTEVLGLIGADTVPNLTAALVDLEEVLEEVRLFHAGEMSAEPWFFEFNADGEAVKRALLFAGMVQYPPGVGVNPLMEYDRIKAQVALVRHPFWETIAFESFSDLSAGTSTLGGQLEFSDIYGTVPARIRGLSTYRQNYVSGTLTEWWIGVRSAHKGTANFEPVWECEDGTNNAGSDTTDQADGGASGGNTVRVTFATQPGLYKRMAITVDDACSGHSDYEHQVGRYLVLCRCKVDSGTAGIQMRSGYPEQNEHQEVYVNNTSYKFHPLGEITIPAWATYRLASNDPCQYFAITLYAERISSGGSDYLYMDCLVLVPMEHLLYMDDTQVDNGGQVLYILSTPDDGYSCYAVENIVSGAVDDSPALSFNDWHLPIDGGVVVAVAQGAASHVLSEKVRLSFQYYPRWKSYRNDSAAT